MKHIATIALITVIVSLTSAPAFASVPVSVPDTASTVALLGAGLVGLLGVRRWMKRR